MGRLLFGMLKIQGEIVVRGEIETVYSTGR